LSDHRELLIEAAIASAAEVGPANVRFSDVIERAGVKRATAYRIFPGAYEGILTELHWELVEDAVRRIRAAVRSTEGSITFERALTAGVGAILEALRDGRLTRQILKSDENVLQQYLLSTASGSLADVLAWYVEGCAATYGSQASELPRLAHWFVLNALAAVEADRRFGGDETWPDPARLAEVLDDRITEFLRKIDLEGHKGSLRQPRALESLAELPSAHTKLTFFSFATQPAA
jgi:AcrR family transcriptional regulator